MARFGVVLDACVLYSITLTDTLLSIAETGLFSPMWSRQITEEAQLALRKRLPEESHFGLSKRFSNMDDAFTNARIDPSPSLVSGLAPICPDPKDAHVVVTALKGRAELIVTANIRDFPSSLLAPLGLHALTPDEFLLDLLDRGPENTLMGLSAQAARKSHPSLTLTELTAGMSATTPKFVAAVQAKIGL